MYKVLGWTIGEPIWLHFSLKSHFIEKRNKIHSYLGLSFYFSRTGRCPPVTLTTNGFLFILKENFYFTLEFLSPSLRETKTGTWREVLMTRHGGVLLPASANGFCIACSGMPITSLFQKFVYNCLETWPLFQKDIWPPVKLTNLLFTFWKHDFVSGRS